MTDEQALEIIRKIEGTERTFLFEDEALKIAEDCLEGQIRYAKVNKERFGGGCPYTDLDCDAFHCWRCEVNPECN